MDYVSSADKLTMQKIVMQPSGSAMEVLPQSSFYRQGAAAGIGRDFLNRGTKSLAQRLLYKI